MARLDILTGTHLATDLLGSQRDLFFFFFKNCLQNVWNCKDLSVTSCNCLCIHKVNTQEPGFLT